MWTGGIIANLKTFGCLSAAVVLTTLNAVAQESPAPRPSASAQTRNVRISFLPPPLEGTISLGIYDAGGKLVRVLHRESDVDEFEAASDALVTHWDGNDNADKPLPAGKYHARGYAVGDLEIEGVGFYFNDWVSDERPERVSKICAIAAEADDVVVSAHVEPSGSESLICDNKGEIVAAREERDSGLCKEDAADAPPDEPMARATGKDHTQWVIERGAVGGVEVKQYSATKELLRRMVIPPEQPQPFRIAAADDADRIYLLERDAAMQRLRGLTLVASTPGADHANSDWKVDFEKKIVAHDDFNIADGKPVTTGGERPPESVRVNLQPNPLRKDEREIAAVAVDHDESGSFLQTADGLPLQTISETTRLKRTVISARDAKSVDVFQDDGAVVEQFRIADLDRMMAFDAGEIELK
jgi:hypothetical protein